MEIDRAVEKGLKVLDASALGANWLSGLVGLANQPTSAHAFGFGLDSLVAGSETAQMARGSHSRVLDALVAAGYAITGSLQARHGAHLAKRSIPTTRGGRAVLLLQVGTTTYLLTRALDRALASEPASFDLRPWKSGLSGSAAWIAWKAGEPVREKIKETRQATERIQRRLLEEHEEAITRAIPITVNPAPRVPRPSSPRRQPSRSGRNPTGRPGSKASLFEWITRPLLGDGVSRPGYEEFPGTEIVARPRVISTWRHLPGAGVTRPGYVEFPGTEITARVRQPSITSTWRHLPGAGVTRPGYVEFPGTEITAKPALPSRGFANPLGNATSRLIQSPRPAPRVRLPGVDSTIGTLRRLEHEATHRQATQRWLNSVSSDLLDRRFGHDPLRLANERLRSGRYARAGQAPMFSTTAALGNLATQLESQRQTQRWLNRIGAQLGPPR